MNTNHGTGLASIIGLVLPQPDSSSVLFPKCEALKAVHQFLTFDFNCCFTLQIHTIVGLPAAFNGSGLLVHWQIRDDEDLVAGPITVIEGVAEFEEQLTFTCFVHRRRIGPGERQNFLIYASVDGQVGFDLGKHLIDLDEIFAPMLEERRQWRRSLSYELQGEGIGAVMKVSFGCLVLEDNPFPPPYDFDADLVEDDSLDQCGFNLNGQVDQVKVSGNQPGSTTRPRQGDENHTSERTESEVKQTPAHLQPTTTDQMGNNNHNLHV